MLAPVAHRHVAGTIPRLLRPLIRRRRDLLIELARAGAETTVEFVRRSAGREVRPGIVVSIATAGDRSPFHALDCPVTVKTASVLARLAIWTR